jgi:hypothetical protein
MPINRSGASRVLMDQCQAVPISMFGIATSRMYVRAPSAGKGHEIILDINRTISRRGKTRCTASISERSSGRKVRRRVPEDKLPNCARPISCREVDAGCAWFGCQLCCMLGIVRPSIPLDAAYRLGFVTDNKNMRRLNAVDARSIFLFKAGEIEWFVPPRIDMWLGKPPLQQRKIGPFKGAE